MQLVPGLVKEPEPLLKLTEPVGVVVVPELVSLTVAVQVVGAFTGTDPGVQVTVVDVVRCVALTAKALELPEWSVSPP